MIYMAGDNGLKFETEAGWTQIMAEMTSAGYTDITELRQAGSTDQVQALVQFDTVSETDRSYRIVINRRGQAPTVHNIPETNTGDPNTLRDFIIWGQQNFPARRYAMILWNHGGGWKADDIYAAVRGEGGRVRRPALFRTTYPALNAHIEQAVAGARARWIAADDASKDFLDNQELAQAFREARQTTGAKIHLIGMDACLMAMAEVAYELRREAEVLVASEEVEPMAGWPYTQILAELNAAPTRSPVEVGAAIVRLYAASYRESGASITQSAITLPRLQELAETLRIFADAVEAAQQERLVWRALDRARLYTPSFTDDDYRDLYEFMRRVRESILGLAGGQTPSEVTGVVDAATAILEMIDDPERTPVVANAVQGETFVDARTGRPTAHGLAIYLPQRGTPVSPLYDRLDFAQTRWNEFLTWLEER